MRRLAVRSLTPLNAIKSFMLARSSGFIKTSLPGFSLLHTMQNQRFKSVRGSKLSFTNPVPTCLLPTANKHPTNYKQTSFHGTKDSNGPLEVGRAGDEPRPFRELNTESCAMIAPRMSQRSSMYVPINSHASPFLLPMMFYTTTQVSSYSETIISLFEGFQWAIFYLSRFINCGVHCVDYLRFFAK